MGAPPQLDAVLKHMTWRTAKLQDGTTFPDLGLDMKALKANFDRPVLIECCKFLVNASDSWLADDFRLRLDDTWRVAMAPADEKERLRYLSGRVVADLMRATGIGP
jgi:hypothetical protein